MNALVLRPDHIGDMLLTTPFLSSLRKSFQDWHITVLCGSWSAPVLKHNPHYDDLIVCDYPWLSRGGGGSWSDFVSAIRAVRGVQYDVVFNLRIAAKSAAVAFATGGRRRWGFDMAKSAWAHTDTIQYRADCHIADLYVEFVAAAGGQSTHDGLGLFLTDEEEADFRSKFSLPKRYAVVSPGAGYPRKLWVNERWAQTADWITRECGLPVAFTGSASEKPLIRGILGRMKEKATDLSGACSIRESAVIIKNAQFLVSVDSAAMHIASAVRTPVAALFGATNPAHWGPYPNGMPNRVVNKIDSFDLGRGSYIKGSGMELIEVEDVRNAIVSLLNAGKRE